MNLKQIDAERSKISDRYHREERLLNERLESAVRKYRVKCVSCSKTRPLMSWKFVQKYWYTSPHGCTGGDYWNRTEVRLCDVLCPTCGQRNYIYNHPCSWAIFDRLERFKYTPEKIFAEVWEQYGDCEPKRIFPKEA